MTTYVVIESRYDYDSPLSGRLTSCASFSTLEYAKEYVSKRTHLCAIECSSDEDYDEYGNGFVFDEEVNDYALTMMIVKTEIDEFI